jgi:preprotein translocase subunit SecG
MGEPTGTQISSETGVDSFLRQAMSLIKIAFLVMLLVYAVFHRADLSDWLSSITHGEAFGIKFDRNAAEQKVDALQLKSISQQGRIFALGAVARAARVGAAVAGARILWLDSNLPNNVAERQVLETMNISVQRALSLVDAERLAMQAALDKEPYDLIISNVSSNDGPGPLVKCPVVYSQVPVSAASVGSLAAFNAQQNSSPRMGFAFAEWLASNADTAHAYMRPEQPRLIFYSGSTGGIVSTICARIVTNYADILLQNVVSALEESRWTNLPPLPASKPASTNSGATEPEKSGSKR